MKFGQFGLLPDTGLVISYPPIEFGLFGLDDAQWAVKRWLETIEASSDKILGLVLGHGDPDRWVFGEPLAAVASWPTAILATFDWRGRPGHAAAAQVVTSVLDVTEPMVPRRARAVYRRKLGERVTAEPERYLDWPSATWTVDDRPVGAHTFSWAGAWGGFTTVGDLTIIVTATGLDMEKLRLTTITDTRSYHFDSREPLTWPDSIATSQELAGIAPAEERTAWPRHPDHEQFLHAD